MFEQHSHHHTKRTRKGNRYWEKEHLRNENFPGEILEGQKLPGGLRSYLVTHTSLGVTRLLFGLYRLQKNFEGLFRPKKN
jgi:hypothetical protein